MQGPEGINMTMTYEIKDLIVILKENRTKHKADYDEAMVNYKDELYDTFQRAKGKLEINLDKLEQELKEGVLIDLSDIYKKVKTHLNEPEEFLIHYDDMIEQLELTSQTTIDLSRAVFKQLVQDEWHWSHSFQTNTVAYLSS